RQVGLAPQRGELRREGPAPEIREADAVEAHRLRLLDGQGGLEPAARGVEGVDVEIDEHCRAPPAPVVPAPAATRRGWGLATTAAARSERDPSAAGAAAV